MKTYNFHWEIETILQMFASALNDILIKRYSEQGVVGDGIHVNFVYAPKNRVLHSLVNKADHFKLPVIAISTGGIKRDVNRVFNKIDGHYQTNKLTTNIDKFQDVRTKEVSQWKHFPQPVPINLTVNVSIITRFQADLDQIITNIIPQACDPYFVISTKWPYIWQYANTEIRHAVHWNENLSVQYPIDVGPETEYRIIADTSFDIQTWLFKPEKDPVGSIYKVDVTFNSVKEIEEYYIMKNLEDLDVTSPTHNAEMITISARPQFRIAYPFTTYANISNTYYADGRMLDYTERLFLSSYDWNMFNLTTDGEFLLTAISGNSLTSVTINLPNSGVQWVTLPITSYWSVADPSVTGIEMLPLSGFSVDFLDQHPALASLPTSAWISAKYPGFSGVELLTSQWFIVDQYRLGFMFTPQTTGVFDVIGFNGAGPGIMTQDVLRPTLNPYPVSSINYNSYIEFQFPCVSGMVVE